MTISESAISFDPLIYRPDFPILQREVHPGRPLVYFDNAATTQRPRQVIQTIVEMYEKHYANVHRGIHRLADETTELYEEARRRVCRFINGRSEEEIIFTSGTTASINLVARAWGDANIASGDEILVTEMEHHSNLVPWFQLAERRGATVRYIPINDQGELVLDNLHTLLTERTKIVAVTLVSNVLGTINPVESIISAAHSVGAKVLVDGAQSVPHLPTDVQKLDADFLAFSGHKMLGPSGIGVLYGKREILEAMPPFMGGGSMIREVRLDGFEPGDLPYRFEAGTPPIVGAVGLGAAIDYLQKIGLERIAAHEHQLTLKLHAMLAEMPRVRVFGPTPDKKAGIASFVVDGIHAHDVAQLLDSVGVAVRAGHHCAMPLHKRLGVVATARVSFYFYNTFEEIDQLAEGLERAQRIFKKRY
ncbi:aminotransferase class V-fold PLP-dependent enzyme [Thermogutta sp.]|uniref:aminotransferase class V-fold PLP-dependent enzyme n=1 Tax=Thermogutta sp. TaxID=1962930 RepID=UPI003C7A6358